MKGPQQQLLKLSLCVMTLSLTHSGFASITLPAPAMTHTIGTMMTMQEAVLLALRNNPNIISSELDRVTQKYALVVAKNAYQPQFTLGGQFTADSGSKATATVSPIAASINQSALGVTGSVNYDPSNGTMNLDLKKQLWAGNSYTANMDPLWTAEEQYALNKLSYQDSIVSIIHQTTDAYRQLVSSKLTLEIDKLSLNSYLEQLKDAKLKLKLGRGTQYDVNQSKLDIAQSKSTIVTDEQNIETDRNNLNEILGLEPNVAIKINDNIPLPPIHLGSLAEAENKALARSTNYYQAKITLKEDKRQLIIAKNANKPTLTYETTGTLGGNTPGPHLTNTLTWGIPIDNVQNKMAILQARVAVIKAQQNLNTVRNQVISQTRLDYNALKNAIVSWHLANQTVALNEETIKQQTALYQAGRLNLFDLSNAKQSLTSNKNNLLSAKDSLWSDLEAFRTDTGTVLSSWGISLGPMT